MAKSKDYGEEMQEAAAKRGFLGLQEAAVKYCYGRSCQYCPLKALTSCPVHSIRMFRIE